MVVKCRICRRPIELQKDYPLRPSNLGHYLVHICGNCFCELVESHIKTIAEMFEAKLEHRLILKPKTDWHIGTSVKVE